MQAGRLIDDDPDDDANADEERDAIDQTGSRSMGFPTTMTMERERDSLTNRYDGLINGISRRCRRSTAFPVIDGVHDDDGEDRQLSRRQLRGRERIEPIGGDDEPTYL